MSGPLLPVRQERTPARLATRPASSAGPAGPAKIAAQHAAFDFELAERAELLREHEALEALLAEQLKNEDDIMKKWIALI